MDLEFVFGVMEINMKVNGKTTRYKEKGCIYRPMVTYTLEIFVKIREQAMEWKYLLMEVDVMDNS
jgi:hypothetical protein